MIMGRRLQGKRCTQLLRKGDAAETLRVIRPAPGRNFARVSNELLVDLGDRTARRDCLSSYYKIFSAIGFVRRLSLCTRVG